MRLHLRRWRKIGEIHPWESGRACKERNRAHGLRRPAYHRRCLPRFCARQGWDQSSPLWQRTQLGRRGWNHQQSNMHAYRRHWRSGPTWGKQLGSNKSISLMFFLDVFFFFFVYYSLINRSQKLFDSARKRVLQCAWWRETMSTRLDPSPSNVELSRLEWTI